MSSWTDINNIKILEEYIWLIHDEKMQQFKGLKQGQQIKGDEYYYSINNNETIVFYPCMQRADNSFPDHTGFDINIVSLPSNISSINVKWNICIDENRYTLNGHSAKLKEKGYHSMQTFSNSSLNGLSSLTIRICVEFF